MRAGAVVVDHGLQPDSAHVADRAAQTLHALGLDPVEVIRVEVTTDGDGVEAAARTARYRALEEAAHSHGATSFRFEVDPSLLGGAPELVLTIVPDPTSETRNVNVGRIRLVRE